MDLTLKVEFPFITSEYSMAKGQQKSNKESKKPKKDATSSAAKPPVGEPVRATITTAVMPKGKEKKKLG